jgi:Protein of unknown function (DUF4089)
MAKARRNKSKRVVRAKGPVRRTLGKAPKPGARDPLDEFILRAARSLGLTIEPAWMPAVRANLQAALTLGAIVGEFALPDDAEPAPVFRA